MTCSCSSKLEDFEARLSKSENQNLYLFNLVKTYQQQTDTMSTRITNIEALNCFEPPKVKKQKTEIKVEVNEEFIKMQDDMKKFFQDFEAKLTAIENRIENYETSFQVRIDDLESSVENLESHTDQRSISSTKDEYQDLEDTVERLKTTIGNTQMAIVKDYEKIKAKLKNVIEANKDMKANLESKLIQIGSFKKTIRKFIITDKKFW